MLDGWDYVELHGTILKANNDPEAGFLEFVPSMPLIPPNAAYKVLPIPFAVQLDATGSFTVMLLATDNVLLHQSPWVWQMTVHTETIKSTRTLSLPAAVPSVNYADVEIS